MTTSNAIHVRSAILRQTGDEASLRVEVLVQRDGAQEPGKANVRVTASTKIDETGTPDHWPSASFEGSTGDGSERYVFEQAFSKDALQNPKAVEIAAVALTDQGPLNAQEPGHNFRPGLYQRDARGRFAVDQNWTIASTSLARRSKLIAEKFGNMRVEDFCKLFEIRSLSELRQPSTRAALLAATLAASPERAVAATMLGATFT
jgi:hypothetical protein